MIQSDPQVQKARQEMVWLEWTRSTNPLERSYAWSDCFERGRPVSWFYYHPSLPSLLLAWLTCAVGLEIQQWPSLATWRSHLQHQHRVWNLSRISATPKLMSPCDVVHFLCWEEKQHHEVDRGDASQLREIQEGRVRWFAICLNFKIIVFVCEASSSLH